jgi:hypothetical protein
MVRGGCWVERWLDRDVDRLDEGRAGGRSLMVDRQERDEADGSGNDEDVR